MASHNEGKVAFCHPATIIAFKSFFSSFEITQKSCLKCENKHVHLIIFGFTATYTATYSETIETEVMTCVTCGNYMVKSDLGKMGLHKLVS